MTNSRAGAAPAVPPTNQTREGGICPQRQPIRREVGAYARNANQSDVRRRHVASISGVLRTSLGNATFCRTVGLWKVQSGVTQLIQQREPAHGRQL
eukprot:7406328-Pyramimonas_sp.AAC.2